MALKSDEVPVGCVFVHNGEVIGRGMNDTNRSLCVRTTATSNIDNKLISQTTMHREHATPSSLQ